MGGFGHFSGLEASPFPWEGLPKLGGPLVTPYRSFPPASWQARVLSCQPSLAGRLQRKSAIAPLSFGGEIAGGNS